MINRENSVKYSISGHSIGSGILNGCNIFVKYLRWNTVDVLIFFHLLEWIKKGKLNLRDGDLISFTLLL